MNFVRIVLVLVGTLLAPVSGFPHSTHPSHSASHKTPSGLPSDSTTTHSLKLSDHVLQFTATAGAIRLFDADDHKPRVDIAYVAYRRTNQDAQTRPVAFVFNGGPGYSSAWMQIGGLGPWRLPMSGDAARPSANPKVIDNADTWLEFTDLVFIDPPGTGYGLVLGDSDKLWSVDGDIEALTEVIRRWCEVNDRMLSPKFLVGESYGGFRAPQIARKLQTDQGIGVTGMILISPALDIGQFWNSTSIMGMVGSLPSMAAVARGRTSSLTASDMHDVEDYASNDFLLDLMKGPNDKDAVARLTRRVTDATGLEFSVVSRLRGRVPMPVFARELRRTEGMVSSLLDGGEAGIDASPFSQSDTSDDQITNGLHAPVTEAMINLYRHQLNWVVDGSQYLFLNVNAHNLWNYGRGYPESITELRQDLALDPSMRVLVASGIFDLDVPYYGTKLMIDQIPSLGLKGRLQLRMYAAGHMIYARDDARKALREDVRRMIENETLGAADR